MVDGPNVYAYVLNNSVSMFDPDGRILSYAVLAFWTIVFVLVELYGFLGAPEVTISSELIEDSYFAKHCVVGCELRRCIGWLGNGWVAYSANYYSEILSNDHDHPSSWIDDEAARWGATEGFKWGCSCVTICVAQYPEGVYI
jgi:hypothetical protein